jgi:hypothetical protein
MYPIEYKWISDPTPVTTINMITDKRSIRNENGIERSPTEIQSNNTTRSGTDPSCATSPNITADTINDKNTISVAIPPLKLTGSRLLSNPINRKPNKGNIGMSHAN